MYTKICEWCGQVFNTSRYKRRFDNASCAVKYQHSLVTPASRFWKYVNKRGENDCWLWLASVNKDGYAKFTIGNKSICGHKFSYELHYGLIPNGELVLHNCWPNKDNPACVNPKHLYLGSNQDNADDRELRGMTSQGENNANGRLVESEVLQILIMAYKGHQQNVLAKLFGVHKNTISEIVRRNLWKHVKFNPMDWK